MYGSRKSNDNGLMTNLNSISSSLSSIDTIGRRTNTKASVDNLINDRSQSIASTSLLWPKSNGLSKNQTIQDQYRYSNTGGGNRNANSRHAGSEIYYSTSRKNRLTKCCCFSPETALNFMLIPTLLLTITRQVFDFLGQVWLQIIINFFTIILLIVALFGIKQRRISYLTIYSLWALFNTFWNIIVLCIYSKLRDVGVNEDFLSLYTGATSWWSTKGPGCLPYNISSIQPSISISQQTFTPGCKLDYHTVESSQASLHALLSFVSSLFCICIIIGIKRNPKIYQNPDKVYRLNTLSNDRSKVNQDPFPTHGGSARYNTKTASLRRAPTKTSSRSSQHSIGSQRSAKRRSRHPSDSALPTPRGSTSSTMQRSQKYGSISSRRSNKKERRSDISSLTYGTTVAGSERAGPSTRTRLSSVSSNDYLPSYQPPHSSNTNLLSSYGEISSIDSYNNHRIGSKNRQTSIKTSIKGNTNPTYNGSRSSIYSHGNPNNINNYDDLSYIYGNNNTRNSENLYAASSNAKFEGLKNYNQQTNIYQSNKSNSIRGRNGFNLREQQPPPPMPQEIRAETHQTDRNDNYQNGEFINQAKLASANGGFQSFSAAPQSRISNNGSQINGKDSFHLEINNNNYVNSDYQESNFLEKQTAQNQNVYITGNGSSTFDSRPRANGDMNLVSVVNQSQVYSNQRNSRYPIYSNHTSSNNGNSETPI